MPGIARHDVALPELDTMPDGAIAAFAAFLRASADSGGSSVSQQQLPADGSFRFAAGTAAKSGASKTRHKARTRQQALASSQHVTATTPAAAESAAVGTTTAGLLLRGGMAMCANGTAVPTASVTCGAASCSLREAPQPVSCASRHSLAQSVLQQPVDAATGEPAATQPLGQSDRRSRAWWPSWGCEPRAAQRRGNMPAADGIASQSVHAAGAIVDRQQGGSPASRSTVYDSADSLQAMTSQVTPVEHCNCSGQDALDSEMGLAQIAASTKTCSIALQLSCVRLAGGVKTAQQMAEQPSAVSNRSAAASQPPLVPCDNRQDAKAVAPMGQQAADMAKQAAAEPSTCAWSPPALPPQQQQPAMQVPVVAPYAGDKSPTPAHGSPVRVHAEMLKQAGTLSTAQP
jgi:hypothetical protein